MTKTAACKIAIVEKTVIAMRQLILLFQIGGVRCAAEKLNFLRDFLIVACVSELFDPSDDGARFVTDALRCSSNVFRLIFFILF